MIGICAPYTRSETTLAASMVANSLQTNGSPVRWFLEGKRASAVGLDWETHLVHDNAKGHELAKKVNCWIYFALGSTWPRHVRRLPATTRHLVFRDWRQYSARWGGPKPTRWIVPEETQSAFRHTKMQKYDFIRWSAGVLPMQQVPPRANKAITVLVLMDRHTCCNDLQHSLASIDRWLKHGHHVVLCSWATASNLATQRWNQLMYQNSRFEWHRKPTFQQLKMLALASDCCILTHRSTAFGAWVAFFRSLGVWTIGNAMPGVTGSQDESIPYSRVLGNKVIESNVWTAEPKRPTMSARLAAFQRAKQIEQQFSEYWNNVWTRPTLSSPE